MGMQWAPLPFNIKMADNTMVVPKGVVKSAKIQLAGIDYVVKVVVLAMKNTIAKTYQIQLGRPWLQDAKVKHDWKRDRITLKGKSNFT